jgi:hypothetical protein
MLENWLPDLAENIHKNIELSRFTGLLTTSLSLRPIRNQRSAKLFRGEFFAELFYGRRRTFHIAFDSLAGKLVSRAMEFSSEGMVSLFVWRPGESNPKTNRPLSTAS